MRQINRKRWNRRSGPIELIVSSNTHRSCSAYIYYYCVYIGPHWSLRCWSRNINWPRFSLHWRSGWWELQGGLNKQRSMLNDVCVQCSNALLNPLRFPHTPATFHFCDENSPMNAPPTSGNHRRSPPSIRRASALCYWCEYWPFGHALTPHNLVHVCAPTRGCAHNIATHSQTVNSDSS